MQQMYQEIYETEDKELHRHNLIKKMVKRRKKVFLMPIKGIWYSGYRNTDIIYQPRELLR